MKHLFKSLIPILAVLLACAGLIALLTYAFGPKEAPELELASDIEFEAPSPLSPEEQEAYQVDISNDMNPTAIMTTNRGVIEIELFTDTMPITAGNFAKLAEEGFYDGIKFHRVIENFMIQAGDPITKTDEVLRYGTGGPGYAIPDEHVEGENLTNVRGTISMANSGPNSGGSQFFINLVDNVNLDFDKPPLTSKHPVFGRVTAGMDVVDAIGMSNTNMNNLPTEEVVIEKVEIVRN